MTQSSVRVTTELPAWAASLYAAIDAGDIEATVAHYGEDIRVRFGNAEPLAGLDAVRAATGQLSASIRGMAHTFREVWERENSAVLVADIDFIRRDGGVVCLPCVTLIHRQPDGLIDDMQMFMDLTPAVA